MSNYAPAIDVGNGVTTLFSIPWPYLRKEDVRVEVNGAPVAFTWNDSATVSVVPAPALGAQVARIRNTPGDVLVTHTSDAIKATSLNFSYKQSLFLADEAWTTFDAIRVVINDNMDDALAAAATAAGAASAANGSAASAAIDAATAVSARNATQAARDTTLAALDSFDDRYLGPKASPPSVDNDGDPLVGGTLYFNTSGLGMQIWTGTVWTAAYVSGTDVVLRSGSTMLGPLVLAADPTANLHAATKQWVDSHTWTISAVINLQTALDAKAALSHTHAQSDVTGLVSALSGKAASSHTHAQSDVTNLVSDLSGKAPASAVASGTNAYGARTVSTSAPSGGSDGDVWYQV